MYRYQLSENKLAKLDTVDGKTVQMRKVTWKIGCFAIETRGDGWG